MKVKILAASLVCLAVPVSAMDVPAEVDELALIYGDKTSVSVATGASQLLRRAPAVATVITAEDIAIMGLTDLDQVIETAAGLHLNRSATLYASLYVVRGIGAIGTTAPHVLMLINGVPINDIYTGDKSNAWTNYPVEHIARIEILRGPGSALYGADAFSGVINIITKDPAQLRGPRVAARVASFKTGELAFSHSFHAGPVLAGLYVRREQTAGADLQLSADAQTLNDSRFGTKVSLAPGPMDLAYHSLNIHLDLRAGPWVWRNDLVRLTNVGMGGGVNQALDHSHTYGGQRWLSDLSWSDPQWAEAWSVGAQVSLNRLIDTTSGLGLFPAGARLGPSFFPDGMIGGPARWQRTVRMSAFAVYSGWSGHTLRLGAGHDDLNLYRAETVKNFLLSPAGVPIPSALMDYNAIQPHITPHKRRNDYLYVQDEWQLARDWSATAGWRHDQYSDFGAVSNPRAALVWDASAELTAKLLYGRAFRAPTFNESYGINPVNSGNPKLQPERNTTTEAVLSWQGAGSFNVVASIFTYKLENLIRTAPNPAPAPGATYANVAHVDGHGGELELGWDPLRELHLAVQHAWQSATDGATGKDPGAAPRRHSFARMDWRINGMLTFSQQANLVGGRMRAAGDLRAPIADYHTLDLALRGSVGAWSLSAALRNAFNADAREPSLAPGLAIPNDLPSQPRSLSLQLSHKL